MPAGEPATRRRLLAAAIVLATIASGGFGAGAAESPTPLRVGTKEAKPFSFRDAGGAWQGITVELWSGIARRLDLRYELVETGLDELIDGVAQGRLDAGAAALTVTAAREEVVDFTHPYFTGGLGIAVSAKRKSGWVAVLEALLSTAFLKVVALLLLLLLLVGALVWWFERKRNEEQFGGPPHHGIGSGFWWSAVTMTTVGYGDKAPRTLGGRIVALVWMFAALIVISGFTAAITSALTVRSLEPAVDGPGDLPRSVVASVPATTSETYLREQGIGFRSYPTVESALSALARGEVDAVVYDRPILRYLVRERGQERLQVLPQVLELEQYAIALPPGSPLREPINRAILEITSRPEWLDRLERYLGP